MSPELEALDQLQGGDLPLAVVAALFSDETHARRAITAMLAAGELALLGPEGVPVSPWQLRELERQPGSWRADVAHRLALTAVGARRIGG